jgi:hypothetical protein
MRGMSTKGSRALLHHLALALVLLTVAASDILSWHELDSQIQDCKPVQHCSLRLKRKLFVVESEINIVGGRHVVIKVGKTGSSPVVLDARGSSRFFNISGSTLILEGPFTLTGGFTSGTGGAISVTGQGNLKMQFVTIASNIALKYAL